MTNLEILKTVMEVSDQLVEAVKTTDSNIKDILISTAGLKISMLGEKLALEEMGALK